MTTYMVIGSNCFTGSHIVDALLSSTDAKVIGVSRSRNTRTCFCPIKNRTWTGLNFTRSI